MVMHNSVQLCKASLDNDIITSSKPSIYVVVIENDATRLTRSLDFSNGSLQMIPAIDRAVSKSKIEKLATLFCRPSMTSLSLSLSP